VSPLSDFALLGVLAHVRRVHLTLLHPSFFSLSSSSCHSTTMDAPLLEGISTQLFTSILLHRSFQTLTQYYSSNQLEGLAKEE
jgi:hypothetical protein